MHGVSKAESLCKTNRDLARNLNMALEVARQERARADENASRIMRIREDALKQRVQFETAMELLREHGLLGNYRAKLAERMSTAAPHAARPPRRMTHSGSAAVSRLLEGFKFTEMPVAAGAASQPASRSAGIRRSVLAPIDQNGLPAGPTEARKKVRARRNDLSSTAGPQLAGDVDRTSNVDDSDVHDKLGTCMVEAAVTEASHLPMRSPHAGTNRLSRARTPATQEGSTAAVGSADDEGPMDSEARRVSERVIRRGVRPLYAELPLNAKLRQGAEFRTFVSIAEEGPAV